jgi:hypothetical protein
LVGEEDPHELMKDGDELEALDLTTAGKFVPHATSLEKKRQERGLGGGQSQQRLQEGRNMRNSGIIYRVIDEQRRRRVTFIF